MSKEFYGFDDDDFKIGGERPMNPWHPITWANHRADFLAWRYVDETQKAVEILAYNYAYGKDLKAFYLERATSLDVINDAIGAAPEEK